MYDLNSLSDMFILKKGHESFETNTIHFLIVFVFCDSNVELLEEDSLIKVKKKYVEVMSFLKRDLDWDNIRVIDQSTNTKKKRLGP
jgi:hypothetical protein